MEIDQYYQKAVGFDPNPLQREVWHAYYESDGHPALLVRAGTGTGKTEAALLPALADKTILRRILMVLPSKALIEDMAERVIQIAERLSAEGSRDLDITVDMGGSCRRFTCSGGKTIANTYFRHLFADDLIITTLDKFLFRLFGYGEKIKSYIFPHRLFGTNLGKKPYIIFDEAHDYEGLAFSNFKKLLEALFTKGKDLCVMSATFPPRFVDFLTLVDATCGNLGEQLKGFRNREGVNWKKKLTLVSESYGQICPEDKTENSINLKPETVSIIAEEVKKRFEKSKRIIARTEYVRDLIALYEKVKDLDPIIYHGRLPYHRRRNIIKEIINRQRSGQGFLVLATSAIETGCDLDAHTIVTEISNPDSLVQLAGRLNRRGTMKDAEFVIVGNKIKPGVSVLTEDQQGDFLQNLANMGGIFKVEDLQKYFALPKGDWMGEILFDMLWDYVYDGDLTSKPLWDRGILVTRSWEPAITLCTGLDEFQRPVNPIQVGISRFAAQINKPADEMKSLQVNEFLSVDENRIWHADIFRAYYRTGWYEDSRWDFYPLPEKYPVSAYEVSLTCRIKDEFIEDYYDPILGYIKIPKLFRRGFKDGFRCILDYQPRIKKDGAFSMKGNYPESSGWVWFLERLDG